MLLDLPNARVTANSILALEELLRVIDTTKLRNDLRGMMISYLMDENCEHLINRQELITEMKFVFEFLDKIEQEQLVEPRSNMKEKGQSNK